MRLRHTGDSPLHRDLTEHRQVELVVDPRPAMYNSREADGQLLAVADEEDARPILDDPHLDHAGLLSRDGKVVRLLVELPRLRALPCRLEQHLSRDRDDLRPTLSLYNLLCLCRWCLSLREGKKRSLPPPLRPFVNFRRFVYAPRTWWILSIANAVSV